MEENASVWYNTVLRADFNPIVIRRGANVQDCAVIHVTPAGGVDIGPGATVGHLCLVHAATVGEEALVGNSSTLLDGVKIGVRAMVAAGSLVTPGTEIPDGMLAMGAPCKVKGPLAGTAGRALGADEPGRLPGPGPAPPHGSATRVTPGPPRHMLLTGFEPFDGDTVNPSRRGGQAARRARGRRLRGPQR